MPAIASVSRAPAVRTARATGLSAPATPTALGPAGSSRAAAPAVRLSPTLAAGGAERLPEPVRELIRAPGSGSPLPASVRAALESSLEVPLAPVRVHSDRQTAAAVDSLGARAFTYGMHIFLGSREQPTDLEL